MNKSARVFVCRWITRVLPLFLTVALLSVARMTFADDILRVEEDWELVLGNPDANSVGPQIVTTMSPRGGIDGTFFTLELNHRSAPTWTPGGITIHRWNADWRMASYDRADRSVMTTNNETVTWTQALYFDNGQLAYKVFNGTSTTWGSFGYTGTVKLLCSYGTPNFNTYSPDISVAQSGAAFAGNRVQSLKIKQIRTTLNNGQVQTDSTERIVQQLVD
jgi:hypothetical protein